MITGLDLDGVVYNWHLAVYDHFYGMDKFDGSYNDFWENYKSFLPEVGGWDYVITIPFLYERVNINEETLQYLNKLSEISDIYYITARDKDLRRVTERWMRRNNLPQRDNLIMSHDKLSYIKLYNIDYFVDDFVSQIEKVNGFCKAYLYANPWNKSHQDVLPTIRSIKEFYNTVKEN